MGKKIQEQLMTNCKMAESDPHFIKACKNANIPATRRQYSKWKMGKGKAYKVFKGMEV